MRTIPSTNHGTCILSDQLYQIWRENKDWSPTHYGKGAKVRLISGIENSLTPGHHFMDGYVTVCREGAERAEFVGVRRSYLKKI
jgi:hypothetical protein